MYKISGTVCNWSLVDKTERRLIPFLKKKGRRGSLVTNKYACKVCVCLGGSYKSVCVLLGGGVSQFFPKYCVDVLNGWPLWINILNHLHVRYMKYLKFSIYSKIWNFELGPHLHHPKFQLHKDVVHSNLNLTDSSHGFWVELHYLLSGIYTE